jgi:cell division protein FtsI/penicillin-binding protein 2
MSWRFRLVLLFFLVCFLLITLQLGKWQIVRAEFLTELGESQYGKSISLIPKRGEIRSSDNFPLAANRLAYLVFANPKQIKDIVKTSDMLSPLLEVDVASISSLLSLNRYWVPLKSGVVFERKKQIEAFKLPGIGFEEQYLRYYPEASLSAHLLGFVGKDDLGKNVGYFGLEGYYDRQLRGKETKATLIHDALGRPILSKLDATLQTNNGRNLVLHLDRVVQYLVENELKNGIENFGAEGGLAIVMRPQDGAILAMASFPTFDPNIYWESDDRDFVNPIIASTYEPGSTFKPIVMASAIDKGVITPLTKCTACDGPLEIGGFTIRTWNNKYFPNQTMTDVIVHSDNTGMAFVGQKLGLNSLLSYLRKFGFGDTTGIDLQGEVPALIRDKNEWYPIDLVTASFGQGISVTPIQLISAFSAIANRGIRMEPHVVWKIETPEGKVIPIPPKQIGKPISAKTAKIMTEILVNAVDKGEAKWAKPKGYRIAGKTGTAQIPVAGHYDPNKTIASFIGFAPADDPKFVMLVVVNRPTTSIFGSETAAPIFFNIAKKLFIYYNIPPSN